MIETISNPATETLSITGVNIQDALARFAGDEKRYRYWLQEFIGHGPAAVQQIGSALNGGSRDTATKLAHALKGRAGMLGMTELHSIAQSLEQSLKDGEPTDLWMQELETSIAEMCQRISTRLRDNTARTPAR